MVTERDKVALTRTARQLTSYRAALVAISSIEKSMIVSENINRCVRLNIQMIRLQAACMEAERKFFNALRDLDQRMKIYIVMKLVDRDSDGRVNLRELAIAFHKMDRTKAFAKSVEDANNAIKKSDIDGDGMLNLEEFESFMNEFLGALGCSFDELCFLLIQWLAFNETGEDIIREALEDNHIIGINQTNLTDFEDEVMETRAALLFQSLDFDGSGKVKLIDVFKRLYNISKTINEPIRTLLFMIEDSKTRILDYSEFTTLILNISAATPTHIQFNGVADAMTFAGATPESINMKEVEDMINTLCMDKVKKEKIPKSIQSDGISPLCYSRIQKLFHLYDENELGCIEADRAVNCIRKLEGISEEIDNVIAETTSNVIQLNLKHGYHLNDEEYTNMICSMASALGINTNDLVSFLVVQYALQNDEKQIYIYVSKMKCRVVQRMKTGRDKYKGNTWNWLRAFGETISSEKLSILYKKGIPIMKHP